MEIIVFPYMAISFMIGWAVYSPFAKIQGLDEWSFARVETSDLLAICLPVGYLLAFAKLFIASEAWTGFLLLAVVVVIVIFVLLGLVVGLYLFAKMEPITFVRRILVVGVVIPLGTLLTLGWVLIPFLAYSSSFLYVIPAAISIVPKTLLLRWLSLWVCRDQHRNFLGR